jgi:hypothetical protein
MGWSISSADVDRNGVEQAFMPAFMPALERNKPPASAAEVKLWEYTNFRILFRQS